MGANGVQGDVHLTLGTGEGAFADRLQDGSGEREEGQVVLQYGNVKGAVAGGEGGRGAEGMSDALVYLEAGARKAVQSRERVGLWRVGGYFIELIELDHLRDLEGGGSERGSLVLLPKAPHAGRARTIVDNIQPRVALLREHIDARRDEREDFDPRHHSP